jgi:hypothetical protein
MLGFVIISHNQPEQLLKLCRKLGDMYGDPPIVCHHDQQKTYLDVTRFSKNVTFVVPPERTGWGEWSVTAAVLRGIRLLYEVSDPDWFTLLSGADYPVSSAASVTTELSQASVDAFMDLRPVAGPPPARHRGTPDPNLAHHDDLTLARKRYLHARLSLGQGRLGQARTIRLPWKSILGPFNTSYQCYVGSQWFTANRRCARALCELTGNDKKLQNDISRRWHADECFINTVLGNNPEVLIDVNPRRYTQWATGSSGPKNLEIADLYRVMESGAHFARKFIFESSAIKEIDKLI